MIQNHLTYQLIDRFIQEKITGRTESLLARDYADHHERIRSAIEGKSMLVIGGAGTIGLNFIKTALRYKPRKLYVMDIAENGCAELVRDLRSSPELTVPSDFVAYPISFNDPVFEKIYLNEGPFDIVANFAAHKLVRSEKDHYSIEAMINNNILHARRLLDILNRQKPEHFFCVSTDKAANPVNVMGASKKMMEDLILSYSNEFKITTARFANVAFSNGSLLDGHIKRLMRLQPLSCPLDIRRYFVSPAESGEICLIACVLGETGNIYFPKLREEQMKNCADVTKDLLEYIGYEWVHCSTEEESKEMVTALRNGSKQYPVYFFPSATSGEKPYEEFYTGNEELDFNTYKELGVIVNTQVPSKKELLEKLDGLNQTFNTTSLDKEKVISRMKTIIPGFNHIETGKSLDQQM